MKSSLSQLLWVAGAAAFPAEWMKEFQKDPKLFARASELFERANLGQAANINQANAATAVFEPKGIFDASQQLVDVSSGSGHEWQAPTSSDLRGPCPGLNAFANHGFLPRNGYATVTEFIEACTSVVGMGTQLATVLAALGGFLDGDVTAWSIGGTPPVSIAGVLGNKGNGISASHNKYESDASPTRPDLYEYGNDYELRIPQFQELINTSPGNSVTMQSLTQFRSKRFDESVSGNPYFFNGPFTGVLVQPAAYTFIYRFMANHSEADPHGLLDYDVLQSWFGVSGSSGSYTVKQGYERIPDNWYKRPIEYPYENTYFLADAANAALVYPKFLSVGGNTGKVNTFTGVDISNLTGGVYNTNTLGQNDNFACLAFETATQGEPDIALNAITTLTSDVGKITSALSCPQLAKIDRDQLKQFPGYTKNDEL